MKRMPFTCVLAILICLGGATAVAQSTTPSGTWTFTGYGLYAYWLDGFIPSGVSIDILYTGAQIVPGLDTIIEDDPGAGWQTNDFYLNADGSRYGGPEPAGGNTSPTYNQPALLNVLGPTSGGNSQTTFDQAEFLNDFGIRQGILWNPEQKRNLLEGFLFYRLRYDRNSVATEWGQETTLLSESNLPDRDQILSNAVLGGLSLNTVATDEVHKTQQGIYGEASVEWAPSFFFNSIGGSDFYRLNATLKIFQTLFTSSTADGSLNLFSGYLADYFGVDYSAGGYVPFYVYESFGGRYWRADNSTTVHGLNDGMYTPGLKILNNLELRVVGPGIVWRDLAPALFVFLDTAYDPDRTQSTVLASTGLGIYVDCFELANLNLYFAYPLAGSRISGSSYTISAAFDLAF